LQGIVLEENSNLFRKAVAYEIEKGAEYLLTGNHLEKLIRESGNYTASTLSLPQLKLDVGFYDEEMQIKAYLDYSSLALLNTQTLISGASGSGKTNLITVLLNELRMRSLEAAAPINFMLFDYKGEYAEMPSQRLQELFAIGPHHILQPNIEPLPINPFEDLTYATETELNLYATTLAAALKAIETQTSISAIMQDNLAQAIIEAYKYNHKKPITFEAILENYLAHSGREDSVTSMLKLLIRSKLFSEQDAAPLLQSSYIVNLKNFPSTGTMAKAIVYFLISKINAQAQALPPQRKDQQSVELRHFTVIDEAHNMLYFDNQPLRKLLNEGRSKGVSVIFATQNMNDYKTEHFDFYTNAQYILLMKQQSVSDSLLKNIFGVSGGTELQEVRQALNNLKKGEILFKNTENIELGIGAPYKKVKVRAIA
jgi:type IV secretory pathway VirB4 component